MDGERFLHHLDEMLDNTPGFSLGVGWFGIGSDSFLGSALLIIFFHAPETTVV